MVVRRAGRAAASSTRAAPTSGGWPRCRTATSCAGATCSGCPRAAAAAGAIPSIVRSSACAATSWAASCPSTRPGRITAWSSMRAGCSTSRPPRRGAPARAARCACSIATPTSAPSWCRERAPFAKLLLTEVPVGRLLVIVVSLVLAGYGTAAAQIVDIEGRYWFADLDASAKVKSGSAHGTRLDLDSDLGIDGGNLPELRLTIATGLNSKIRFAYTHGDFEGDKTIERSVQFAGTTFTATSRVESEMELHYGRIGWAWQFIAVPGIFKIGPLLELKGLVIDASLRTRGAGTNVHDSAVLPMAVPTVGAMANVTPVKWLDVFAEVSGIPFGDLGHIVDAEAGVRVIPLQFLSFSAGYRVLDVRLGKDDNFARLNLAGPFLGASLRF